ncbi:hypothetical protein ACIRPP_14285 [Streptomyces sp. NPDC101219]|uniref:hypothetical protein n=1 Tax=Streptomyces sp. NPDC101219 TaxID=3366131 RepID=UPI0038271955
MEGSSVRAGGRDQPVTAAGRRIDVAAVPQVTSPPPPLDGVAFRDGDRVTRLRTVDPDATEETWTCTSPGRRGP